MYTIRLADVQGAQCFVTDIHRSLGRRLLFTVHVADVNLTQLTLAMFNIFAKTTVSCKDRKGFPPFV